MGRRRGGGFVERSDFELPVGDYLVSVGGDGAAGGNKDLTRAGGRGGNGIAIVRFAAPKPFGTVILVR